MDRQLVHLVLRNPPGGDRTACDIVRILRVLRLNDEFSHDLYPTNQSAVQDPVLALYKDRRMDRCAKGVYGGIAAI